MIEVNHRCDAGNCRSEADECFCRGCLEDEKKEAYNEGYKNGQKDAKE